MSDPYDEWLEETADHGPQDEFRELTPEEAQEAYDNAPSVPLSKERINEIVAYATGKTTDHGPQDERPLICFPETAEEEAILLRKEVIEANLDRIRLRDELARLRAENERLRAVLERFADRENWFQRRWDRLGDPCRLAADALRGEESCT